MKLSQDDKLLLIEGRLKEAIAASRKIRRGKFPSGETPSYIAALSRELGAANKLVEGMR
jgi:hypothetical protein